MQLTETCVNCLLDKKLKDIPAGAAPERVANYQSRVREAILNGRADSSPELHGVIAAIYRENFGPERDFTDVKRRFNALMLALEPALWAEVETAPDPLARAVQYAMAGNFIDFAALGDVDEGELRRMLDDAADMAVDGDMLAALRREALAARRLVYFTDNCGEIAADKLLLRALKRLNPGLRATVIVRGMPVVNDATLEDAEQVRMAEVADRVMGNGIGLPGNVLRRISPEALAEVDAADMLISKGQANYEGLAGCGRNIFYIFLCKCDMFTRRFGVPRLTGILTRER